MEFLNRVYKFEDLENSHFLGGLPLSELHYCLDVVDGNIAHEEKVYKRLKLNLADSLDWTYMTEIQAILSTEISRRLGRFNAQSAPPAKVGRKKNDPLPFDAFFKDKGSLERFLLACVSAGIICKDGEGFLWIDEGAKGHRVRAMWEAAKDLGILKSKGVPNMKTVCKEIEKFFNMVSLSHTTLDELNPIHKEFQTVKAEIQKKFRELKG